MYLPDPAYASVAALVQGYDLATEGGVLTGFREWLIPRVDGGNELSWESLVLRLAFPEVVDPHRALADEGANTHAIDLLFKLIADFDDERRARNGLRRIYKNYENWLQTQPWHQPGTPGWV